MENNISKNSTISGAAAEHAAWSYLLGQGLKTVQRNFRCKWGEIDLIMREGDTVIFVEVRQRCSTTHGGALASVTRNKQKRLILASQVFLQRYQHNKQHNQRQPPSCRFDVIAYDGDRVTWVKNVIEVV